MLSFDDALARVKVVAKEIGLDQKLAKLFPACENVLKPRSLVSKDFADKSVVVVFLDVFLAASQSDDKAMQMPDCRWYTANTCAFGLMLTEIDVRTTRELAALMEKRFEDALPTMHRVTLYQTDDAAKIVGIDLKE